MKSISLSVDKQSNETYLNHPNFGLLYRICLIEDNQELFTTLYAQRLFFLVTISTDGFKFEPITRSDARLMVEVRLRKLRSQNNFDRYQELEQAYKRTFQ
ncbi:MAG: PipX family protein [Xenococcus sp. MO_188.B8]|nr:PipX family protein [Xenococcus sp. MO_188.B8]